MNSHHPSEDEIFEQARQLSGVARAAYLRDAAGHDEPLHQRIEKLLQASENAGDFLSQPAAESAGTLVITAGMVPVTEQPGDKIGRYKLREKIGEGGCGVVYVADQEEPVRRRVALKIIKLGMDTRQVVARFEAERQALALMDHPNIAKVLDAGATDTGRPYFVMELVRGIRITDYCDKNNLPTEERLKLFIQVCSAIQHAHQKGIIHRDIKPSNILVTLHDGVPVPKVIDFGIAKATSDQRLTDKTIYTAFEQFIGTPAYMSPEQAEMSGLDIDTRSDIYSLGVLLYELLTGRTPFDSATLLKAGLDQMRRIIREQEPQRPSTRLSTLEEADLTAVAEHRRAEPPKLVNLIRGDLDWIVMKSLEKDRTRRFETANALAMDVERHMNDEPVIARPPSQLYRFRKLVHRNKVAFGGVAAVTVVLVMGVLVSTWQAVRATKAEHEQIQLRTQADSERMRAEAEKNEAQIQTGIATREKDRADDQARIAMETLEQMKIQKAEDLFKADNTSLALAMLAQVLRQNPSNRVAAERVMAALMQRDFRVPLFPPLISTRMAEFSPDGRRLAMVDTNEHLAILDAHTGQRLVGPITLSNVVESLEFSPDGTQLLTASSNRVFLWETLNLFGLGESPLFLQPIRSVHFTPDGPRAIVVKGTEVSILDGIDGSILTGPLQHKFNLKYISLACFSRDGHRLMVGSGNSELRVWDVKSGAPITELLDVGGSSPCGAFSPDGRSFVVGSSGAESGYIFDTGVVPLKRLVLLPPPHINCLDYGPDGRTIATAGRDKVVRIWEAATGQLLNDSIHRLGRIQTIQFDPAGKRVITSSEEDTTYTFSGDGVIYSSSTASTIRLWDASNGRPLSEELRYGGRLTKVKISPDGSSVLLKSRAEVQVWDLRHGNALAEPEWNSDEWSEQCVSPDGTLEVRFDDKDRLESQARIVDRQTRKPLSGNLITDGRVTSMRFSPNSQRLVLATVCSDHSDDCRALVFDTRTGRSLMDIVVSNSLRIYVEFSPNGQQIVTASANDHARVWDVQNGVPITEPLLHGVWGTSQAKFNPDGSLLLTLGATATARIWNAKTGTSVLELRHDSNVNSAEFSPNGTYIVTAGQDRTARIWDAITGKMLQVLRHETAVQCATFRPDGMTVATGSRDGVVRVWDTRTGQPVTESLFLPNSNEGVNSVRFTNDGKRLRMVVGTGVFLWDVPDVRVPAPSWLADLAEAMGGKCLGEGMQAEPVFPGKLFAIREQIKKTEEVNADPYVHWAKWFFSDRATRAISPGSKITVREYIERCTQENNAKPFEIEAAEQLASGDVELLQRISKTGKKLQLIEQARALNEHAGVLSRKDNLTGAEIAYREALAIRRTVLGSENREVVGTMYDLAQMLHYRLHRYVEAESLYREALAILRILPGNNDQQLADTLDGLAVVLEAQGRFSDAEKPLKEALAMLGVPPWPKASRAVEGKWHSDNPRLFIFPKIKRLVLVLRQQGKVVEAEALCGELVRSGNEELLNCLARQMAMSVDVKSRDGTDAVVLAEKAVELTDRKKPYLLDTLAAAYAETGQFEKAVSVQEEAIALLEDVARKDEYASRLKLYKSNTPYHEEGRL